MGSMSSEVDPRQETQAERNDRNLAELLQELRVAGLGIQVLFGFLLSLPFTTRFSRLSGDQRDIYLVTILLATVSIALLVAPVAYHRLVFRRNQKEHLVRAANVLAMLGLATVGLSVSGAVLLVVSYVARSQWAGVVIAACVLCVFGGLWFVLPLGRRLQ